MKTSRWKILLLLLIGCSVYYIYEKKEDRGLKWRVQGETWAEKHIKHLKQIESASDFKRLKKAIQQDYQELADLLVDVYHDNKSEIHEAVDALSSQGLELQKEMERVLQIEGGKKYFDQCQKTTMLKFARGMRQDSRSLSTSATEKKESKSALRSTKKE